MAFLPSPPMAVAVCVKLVVLLGLLFGLAQSTRLYTEEDPVVILSSDSLKQTVLNSSSAWLLQFYSSWCGHCIQYSPTWKALAGDVKDWAQAIQIGVVDCAHEKNFDVCKEFGIHFYPTFRGFISRHKWSFLFRDTEFVICYRSAEILSLMGKKTEFYTAVIVEDEDSYIGREVILDLMPYEGLAVKRALSSDKLLMEKLGISSVPSAYLFYPNSTHTVMNVQKRLRFFFSSFLKLLPGVHRKRSTSSLQHPQPGNNGQGTQVEWKEFEKSKVYMADLESGLHYLLRVELATHKTLEGEELKTFKDFVTVVAKLFPGHQSVVKLLETLLEWLVSLPLEKIPYDAILDLVNNKMRISGLYLNCSVGRKGKRENFLNMLADVTLIADCTRYAGSMSEDSMFPKTQWPTPDLCPTCHEEQEGLHVWNEQMVLAFLRQHYGASNISPKYSSNSQPEPGPPAPDKPKAITKPNSNLHLNQNLKPSPDSAPKHQKRSDTNGAGQKLTGIQIEARPGMTILGLGFSRVDMSLCVFLYALSCVFLMFMFFFFRFRSKRWKPRNYRPYV
ncbi:sulfhydryl oxidase 2-like [Sinocyclocheilus rhinocerous]|uniref:sulfhydryl oxidase 2-like n=1 Tax=Sinocyclocheilus rhinocerous TaxID=307959 RepID=UPI0007B7E4C8|nr:PREDICTED: sulfhydryl oxidase 2-like [Sinocyclocheilus rhinocerous]